MQPHDVYNRNFDVATAELDRWLPCLADVADVDREATGAYWRVALQPHVRCGCPIELMLTRAQTCDVEIGPEGLSNQPVTDFSLYLPLLQAVVDGHVVHRRWSALATRCVLTREIVVHLADGREWSVRRVVSAGTAATEQTATASDHVYLPYRRAHAAVLSRPIGLAASGYAV